MQDPLDHHSHGVCRGLKGLTLGLRGNTGLPLPEVLEIARMATHATRGAHQTRREATQQNRETVKESRALVTTVAREVVLDYPPRAPPPARARAPGGP